MPREEQDKHRSTVEIIYSLAVAMWWVHASEIRDCVVTCFSHNTDVFPMLWVPLSIFVMFTESLVRFKKRTIIFVVIYFYIEFIEGQCF